MINTSHRRLAIVKWLKDNNPSEFYESLKIQKYLFFYELFSKVEGKEYSLNYLKGYENGPVFSELYGDYTYRINELMPCLDNIETENVCIDLAKKASFLVQVLNGNELSNLTHELNLWKAKEEEIISGGRHIPLDEKSLDQQDISMIEELFSLYSTDFISTSNIVSIKDKNFLFNDEDFKNLTNKQKEVLELLAEEELENPVYVAIGEKGELLVD